MIKLYITLALTFIGSYVHSQTQYASSVIDFSSQYTTGNWSAAQATGIPSTTSCGDISATWAPATQDGQREYLVLGYATPQRVSKVLIYQNYNPGAIDTVYIRNASTGVWTTVYTATAAPEAVCPATLTINFALTSYDVDAVRIAVNSPAVAGYNEIDAVAISNNIPFAYPSSVIDFSSQYSGGGYTADKALGTPDVYPSCGDYSNAWASASTDGQREYIVLGYSTPQQVTNVVVYQTFNAGAVDTVYLRDAGTGNWNTVYTATAAPASTCPLMINIEMPVTSYNVDAVRLALNSPAVTGYNEIDAVGLANTTNISLPVLLTSFTAEEKNGAVQLKWATGTEINTAYFQIEKSADGKNFRHLQTVAAKNALTGSTYQDVDLKPFAGSNFYRLKTVDIDGKYAYSPVVKLDVRTEASIVVSPNPAQSFISVNGIANLKQLRIIDNNGKKLKEFAPASDNKYSVQDLKPGLYILQFISETGTQSQKLIIQ